MQIIGHNLIKFDYLNLIKNIDEIYKFDNLLFTYNEDFIKISIKENKKFSILAKTEEEIVLANAMGAKFIVLENLILTKNAINLAEFYLFDSKIAIICDDLKTAILNKVDVCIFKNAIKNNFYE
ncbi:hypothetical protein F1B92_04045 [Campylobacter sp. FMV-PI01]|uniref:Uncharacterized protein n=1 Tax=Campylobacter portucalensis TaxID=2608384 RepID=A0A6L5WH49_9BACT|nr:hypothetical protein [Campylobacter portucalensis]MSN96364.1 hypothetical protein [Campylobacter portucalensis]